VACYDRSKSFKVIEVGTNRKTIRDSLIVFHCNYMPSFYCFRDITIYWLKVENIRFFAVFYPSQSHLKPSQLGFLLDPGLVPKQEAQLSQKSRAMPRVVEYFR